MTFFPQNFFLFISGNVPNGIKAHVFVKNKFCFYENGVIIIRSHIFGINTPYRGRHIYSVVFKGDIDYICVNDFLESQIRIKSNTASFISVIIRRQFFVYFKFMCCLVVRVIPLRRHHQHQISLHNFFPKIY